jgi:hypothetical protein
LIHHGAVASRGKKSPRKPTQGRMKRTSGRPSFTDIFQNLIKFFMAEVLYRTVCMFYINKFSNKTNSPFSQWDGWIESILSRLQGFIILFRFLPVADPTSYIILFLTHTSEYPSLISLF